MFHSVCKCWLGIVLTSSDACLLLVDGNITLYCTIKTNTFAFCIPVFPPLKLRNGMSCFITIIFFFELPTGMHEFVVGKSGDHYKPLLMNDSWYNPSALVIRHLRSIRHVNMYFSVIQHSQRFDYPLRLCMLACNLLSATERYKQLL